jgi:hypothetical protein
MENKKKYQRNEVGVFDTIKKMCNGNEPMAYYIVFRYAPEFLTTPCKSIEDLRNTYKRCKNISAQQFNRYMYSETAQKAAKWLLHLIDGARMCDLYDIYYQKALKGDMNAFKTLLAFRQEFFKDNESNELMKILQNANVDDEEEDIDFSMDFDGEV